MKTTSLKVLNVTADASLGTEKFACNLGACHGACCTMPGGSGAPLAESELVDIDQALSVVMPYLSERNREYIKRRGATEGTRGNYSTRCIDRRDCVFVYYQGEVAKCAIERAYFDGKSTFRKPISCHLFPIRVYDTLDGPHLYYESIKECEPARVQGAADNVRLLDFLKDAIERAYGPEVYQALVASLPHPD